MYDTFVIRQISLFRSISWKKFKAMVQKAFANDQNQLDIVLKLLQNLWNLTRNLIGKMKPNFYQCSIRVQY